MLRRFVLGLDALERFASHHLMDEAAGDNRDERTNGTKPSLYLGVSAPRFACRSRSWQEREPLDKWNDRRVRQACLAFRTMVLIALSRVHAARGGQLWAARPATATTALT